MQSWIDWLVYVSLDNVWGDNVKEELDCYGGPKCAAQSSLAYKVKADLCLVSFWCLNLLAAISAGILLLWLQEISQRLSRSSSRDRAQRSYQCVSPRETHVNYLPHCPRLRSVLKGSGALSNFYSKSLPHFKRLHDTRRLAKIQQIWKFLCSRLH